jgi:hypothetical protein
MKDPTEAQTPGREVYRPTGLVNKRCKVPTRTHTDTQTHTDTGSSTKKERNSRRQLTTKKGSGDYLTFQRYFNRFSRCQGWSEWLDLATTLANWHICQLIFSTDSVSCERIFPLDFLTRDLRSNFKNYNTNRFGWSRFQLAETTWQRRTRIEKKSETTQQKSNLTS